MGGERRGTTWETDCATVGVRLLWQPAAAAGTAAAADDDTGEAGSVAAPGDEGGGLVGGDTYPYFLPQKIVLAESFARGELPLWHNLTGLGYPLHAESQAGVFYPTNQILYRL